MTKNLQQNENILDLQKYWSFRDSFENNDPKILTHPVYGIIRNKAYPLAKKWDRLEELQDIINQVIIALCRYEYQGRSSLGWYISVIIENAIRFDWKKKGKGMGTELPEDVDETFAENGLERTIKKVTADVELMREIMKRPELQRKVAKILVMEFGGKQVSQAKVIRALTPEYKRSEIINAYKKLKGFLKQQFLRE